GLRLRGGVGGLPDRNGLLVPDVVDRLVQGVDEAGRGRRRRDRGVAQDPERGVEVARDGLDARARDRGVHLVHGRGLSGGRGLGLLRELRGLVLRGRRGGGGLVLRGGDGGRDLVRDLAVALELLRGGRRRGVHRVPRVGAPLERVVVGAVPVGAAERRVRVLEVREGGGGRVDDAGARAPGEEALVRGQRR